MIPLPVISKADAMTHVYVLEPKVSFTVLGLLFTQPIASNQPQIIRAYLSDEPSVSERKVFFSSSSVDSS